MLKDLAPALPMERHGTASPCMEMGQASASQAGWPTWQIMGLQSGVASGFHLRPKLLQLLAGPIPIQEQLVECSLLATVIPCKQLVGQVDGKLLHLDVLLLVVLGLQDLHGGQLKVWLRHVWVPQDSDQVPLAIPRILPSSPNGRKNMQ